MPALAAPEPSPTAGQRQERKAAVDSLHLTQEQKNRIHEIRKNTPEGAQRREALMKVLTPEQRATLKARLGKRPHAGKTPGGPT